MHGRGIDHNIGLQPTQASAYGIQAGDFNFRMGKRVHFIIPPGKRLYHRLPHLAVCSNDRNFHTTSKTAVHWRTIPWKSGQPPAVNLNEFRTPDDKWKRSA